MAVEMIRTASAREAGAAAAEVVANYIAENPRAVLGLATGSSPLPTYEALQQKNLDLDSVQAFALDEYLGLGPRHEQRYQQVVRREVIQPLGLRPSLVRVPDGLAPTPEDEAERFEASIRCAGGIDLQILGIGTNGHLAFNEPGSSFSSRTRVVELAETTRRDNARFFDSPDEVPTHAITQGLGTIFEARHLLLIAHGPHKAQAVARAVQGPITQAFPASMIQRHPHVTIVLDRSSARFVDT